MFGVKFVRLGVPASFFYDASDNPLESQPPRDSMCRCSVFELMPQNNAKRDLNKMESDSLRQMCLARALRETIESTGVLMTFASLVAT
jgi:hypothetical protein